MKFKALALLFPWKDIHSQIKHDKVDLFYRHDIPVGSNVPKDLADIEGPLQLTKSGFPVAGRLLPEETSIGSRSPALPLYIALYALVAVLISLLPVIGLGFLAPIIIALYFIGFVGFFGFLSAVGFSILTVGASSALLYAAAPLAMTGIAMSTAQSFLNILPGVLPILYLFFTTKQRASEKAHQGATYASAARNAPKSHKNPARHMQAIRAMSDKTDFIVYGTAKGNLTFNGDSFAPDEGLQMGQSVNDLSTHLAIFGSTGSGKTTQLRTIFSQIANEPEGDKE